MIQGSKGHAFHAGMKKYEFGTRKTWAQSAQHHNMVNDKYKRYIVETK